MSIISVDDLKKNIPFYMELLETEKKMNARVFIVGGAIRDLFMGVEIKDVDITVENVDYAVFAKEFSDIVKTRPIPFKDNFRIVKKGYELDISVLRGKDIYEDTSLRDFTINNMAISLDGYLAINNEKDILDKKIRVVYDKTFDADPIRIIRGLRFASTLGFEIENETIELMVEKKNLLKTVAKERILAEMKKMFDGNNLKYSLNIILEKNILSNFVNNNSINIEDVINLKNNNIEIKDDFFKSDENKDVKKNYIKNLIKKNTDFALLLSLFVDDMNFIEYLGLSVKEYKSCAFYKNIDYKMLKKYLSNDNKKELKRYVFFNKENIIQSAIYLLFKFKDEKLFLELIDICDNLDFENAKNISGDVLKKIGVAPSPIYSTIIKETMFALAINEISKLEIENYITKKFIDC